MDGFVPLADLDATRRAGRALAAGLVGGELILLEGPLGAGKTSLAQGLAEGLGVPGAVTSPTFALCNQLQGRLELHHYDLYRIESVDQLRRIGFEESLDGGAVVVVEWPALALPLLRGEALLVELRHQGDARAMRVQRVGVSGLSTAGLLFPDDLARDL